MPRKGNSKNQPASQGMRTDLPPTEPQSSASRDGGIAGNGSRIEAGAGDGAADQMFNSDQIAERAYQIFERDGRADGRDMDHWLQAERELRLEREKRSGEMNPENQTRSARQHQRM